MIIFGVINQVELKNIMLNNEKIIEVKLTFVSFELFNMAKLKA